MMHLDVEKWLSNGRPGSKINFDSDKDVHLVVKCHQFHQVIGLNLTCPEKMTLSELIFG